MKKFIIKTQWFAILMIAFCSNTQAKTNTPLKRTRGCSDSSWVKAFSTPKNWTPYIYSGFGFFPDLTFSELGIGMKKSLAKNVCLNLEVSNNYTPTKSIIAMNESKNYDENGILDGTWNSDSIAIHGLSSLALSIGAEKKINSKFSVGLTFDAHRNYRLSSRLDEAKYTMGPTNKPERYYYVGGQEVPFEHNSQTTIERWNYTATLKAKVQFGKGSAALVYRQGLRDITNNNFFKNQVRNHTQYLGIRLSYQLFQLK